MITAVVCDNGEPLVEKCLESLWNQTIRPEIIVCTGPKSNTDLITRYADKVIESTEGIGAARVKGILAASHEYIVSCDADTIYDKHYCEYALQNLKMGMKFIRAGTIIPHEWSEPLTLLEVLMVQIVPYEFSLAFNREAFLNERLHEEDYSRPRVDISTYLYTHRIPVWPDFRMVCWTRLPTYGAHLVGENFLPSAILGLAPVAAMGAFIGVDKLLHGRIFDLW